MKHTLTILLMLATLACFIPRGVMPLPQAQAAPAVVATPQYKVIDMTKITVAAGRTVSESIEVLLNDMAAQGWRLVSISGSLMILTND